MQDQLGSWSRRSFTQGHQAAHLIDRYRAALRGRGNGFAVKDVAPLAASDVVGQHAAQALVLNQRGENAEIERMFDALARSSALIRSAA